MDCLVGFSDGNDCFCYAVPFAFVDSFGDSFGIVQSETFCVSGFCSSSFDSHTFSLLSNLDS